MSMPDNDDKFEQMLILLEEIRDLLVEINGKVDDDDDYEL